MLEGSNASNAVVSNLRCSVIIIGGFDDETGDDDFFAPAGLDVAEVEAIEEDDDDCSSDTDTDADADEEDEDDKTAAERAAADDDGDEGAAGGDSTVVVVDPTRMDEGVVFSRPD